MADNKPLSLATIELQAQETGSTRYMTFFAKLKNSLNYIAAGIFVVWLSVNAYSYLGDKIQELKLQDWKKTEAVTVQEKQMEHNQTLLESVGFTGWTPEDVATDQSSFIRLILDNAEDIDRVEMNGMRACWKAGTATHPLMVQYLGVGRRWTDWYEVGKLHRLIDASAFQFNAPLTGTDGNSPMAVYVILLPPSVIPDCNNEIVNTIFDIANRRKSAS